ncbi:DUF6474 family protein [Dietzia lutea]|uniref:DUF6474 family protein n=1 Tax=Dietzia lutea TaxID=546160 RepID=UPI001FCA33BE
MELDKLKGTKLGKDDVQRWLNMAKVATPVLLPLVYKVVSNAQSSDKTAEAGGVDLKAARHQRHRPRRRLGARIVRLERTLDGLETSRGGEREVKDFVASTRTRLTDLRTAVETAETTPTAQRREIHSSISGELDRVNKDVLARLGVKRDPAAWASGLRRGGGRVARRRDRTRRDARARRGRALRADLRRPGGRLTARHGARADRVDLQRGGQPDFASVAVTAGDDRTNRVTGEPMVDGETVTARVDDLAPGAYTVGYRVTSADGHVVSGSSVFTVADAEGGAGADGGAAGADGGGEAEGGAGAEDSDAGGATASDAGGESADADATEADVADETSERARGQSRDLGGRRPGRPAHRRRVRAAAPGWRQRQLTDGSGGNEPPTGASARLFAAARLPGVSLLRMASRSPSLPAAARLPGVSLLRMASRSPSLPAAARLPGVSLLRMYAAHTAAPQHGVSPTLRCRRDAMLAGGCGRAGAGCGSTTTATGPR